MSEPERENFLQPRHLVLPLETREKVAVALDQAVETLGPRTVLALLRTFLCGMSLLLVLTSVIGTAWLFSLADLTERRTPWLMLVAVLPYAMHVHHAIKNVRWAMRVQLREH